MEKQLPTKYLTTKRVSQKYDFLPPNRLKNFIFNNVNGFRDQLVKKIGKTLFIDEEALLQFIANSKYYKRKNKKKERDSGTSK